MEPSELKDWAERMAALNPHPFDWITPVLLYRNGQAAMVGAYVLMEGNKEIVFTASHGFSTDYPSAVWRFQKLGKNTREQRPIVKAAPMRNADDDVAICTPANILQVSSNPLPNFYSGMRHGFPHFEFLNPVVGTARCVLSGEDVALLGEARIDGKLHVALDLEASEGQSGSVFVNEEASRMYVVRGVSTVLTREMKRHSRSIKHGVTFAVRLAFA